MLDGDLRYWLALNAADCLSIKHLQKLASFFDSLESLFRANRTDLLHAGLTAIQTDRLLKIDHSLIDHALDWQEIPSHSLIPLTHSAYPPLLKQIDDPPLLLYACGQKGLLTDPQLAIVGSRKPTPQGVETAHFFAQKLSGFGLTITSGMALGIDAASHRGALITGNSIGVLGTGIDQEYPRQNRSLYEAMRQTGLIISEFSLGTPPTLVNFPRRNRLISGLSLGTLVIEAAIKSGSLITARYAAQQGREVFTLPGSIYNVQSRGCHQLLREGACLVEKPSDVLTELSALPLLNQYTFSKQMLDFCSKDEDHNPLLASIGQEPTSVEQIIHRTGFTVETVSAMLLDLELQQKIKSTSGGYCKVRNS